MTDQEKLTALRAAFKTGRPPESAREVLLAEGLVEERHLGHGDSIFSVTPKGLTEAERLGATDPDTQRLRVWKNGVVEWVIAATPEEATRHLQIHLCEIGLPFDDMDRSWQECRPWRSLTMTTNEGKFTRLPAQWAALQGPGFLGSTEY